jgi:hypothetical protein
METKAIHLSVSSVDPPKAHAGEREQWAVRLGGPALPPGARVKVVLADGSQPSDWGALQVDKPRGEGYVSARSPEGVSTTLRVPAREEGGETAVEVILGEPGLLAGEVVEIVLGDLSRGGRGLRAQTFTQRRSALRVLVDIGDGTWRPAEPAPVLEVAGGPADRVRLVTPSTMRPGDRFEALVRAEDRHGNQAGFYQGIIGLRTQGGRAALPEEIVVSPRDESSLVIRGTAPSAESLSFRIQAEDLRSGDEFLGNPVLLLGEEDPYHLYWGVLHGSTELSDGVGTPEEYFERLRDDNWLDFGALGDTLAAGDDEVWHRAAQAVAQADEPGRFVALPGYEWAPPANKGDGNRGVYYLDDAKEPLPGHEAHCPWVHDLFEMLHRHHLGRTLVAPLHTAWAGGSCDFTQHDPLHERLIGMYSAMGCSERSVHDGNLFPMRPPGLPDGGEVRGVPLDAGEAPESFVQRALALGWRVGFTGGGDDRHGHPGDPTRTGPEPFRYRDGLVGVWATELTRQSIWDGLWNRRTVASTGPRIILRWQMGEHQMGEDVEARPGDGVLSQRSFNVEAHGQARIVTLEVVRNNEVVHRARPESHDASVTWTDQEPFEDFALRPKSRRPPFAFYYVRVLQDDGEMAWASPIWITAP